MKYFLLITFYTDVDAADDILAFLTSLQMLMTLLGGLLIKTDDPNSPTYDRTFLERVLIAINSLGFIALICSLILIHPKCRQKADESQFGGVHGGAQTKTKVSPSEKGGGERVRNWD